MQKYIITILLTIFPLAAHATDLANTIQANPPVVVKTIPQSGSEIPAGETEITVSFSKDMADHSWSWVNVWEGSAPQTLGPPSFDAAKRTCTIKAKLESGKTYGYWINSEKFGNFKDSAGHAAVPYLLIFKVR